MDLDRRARSDTTSRGFAHSRFVWSFFDHMIHAPSGGFAGVDMFFVISGFLITGLLLREYQGSGTISFSQFYLSRIKRIIPAALLVLVITVVLAFAFLGRGRAVDVAGDAVWAALFGANWHFLIRGTDYFQQDAAVSPLQHFWSLSVEEQFYFVWPWLLLGLLLVAAKFAKTVPVRRIAAIAMGVVVVLSFGGRCTPRRRRLPLRISRRSLVHGSLESAHFWRLWRQFSRRCLGQCVHSCHPLGWR